MIRHSCFEYPKTVENAADFEGWQCSICREDDPELSGNTVAHEGDGRKHPIHRDCLLRWGLLCPVCKEAIDMGPLVSLMEKCAFAAIQRLHSVFVKTSNWIEHPTHRIYAGLTCLLAGLAWEKKALISLGMALQGHGLYQAIRYGSGHIPLLRQMEEKTNELLAQFCPKKFEELKLLAAQLPAHSLDTDLSSLKQLAKQIRCALLAHRILCFLKWYSIGGAFYFGIQSLPRLNMRSVKYLAFELLIQYS